MIKNLKYVKNWIFHIKDINVAKYLYIELNTFRKRLNNMFAKLIIFIENVDFIKNKSGKTIFVIYMINYQCFEGLVMGWMMMKYYICYY